MRFGQSIIVQEGEYIANHLINSRCYDPALSEFLWRMVRPGDVCVDIGANIGYTTLLMAGRCGGKGTCLSVEADPVLFEQLRQNVQMNDLDAIVQSHNLAASAKDSILHFQPARGRNLGLGRVVPESESGHGPDSITVKAVAMDGFLLPLKRIRIVKLDVEGHELEVVRGMAGALRTHCIQNLVFEDHSGQDSPVLSLLSEHGYTIFRLLKNLAGPRLLNCSASTARDLEPNYVATLFPAEAEAAIKPAGWHVF